MALAGSDKKDINIEVAEGVLTVKSIKDKDKGATDEYTVYKGISQRNFTRKFTLADDIVVNDAKLVNGMLTIYLERIIPERKTKNDYCKVIIFKGGLDFPPFL